MMIKEMRQRYIAFIIEDGSTDRKGMIAKIREYFADDEYRRIRPWLLVFTGDKGIVRCNHLHKDRCVEILNSMRINGGNVQTVTTSGTIKKAKETLLKDG